jgi:hypothetical protein
MTNGYGYHQQQPVQDCPYCGAVCDADFVDVGVGHVQCGPYYCQRCKASEIGEFDTPRELTEDEKRTGWYAPGAPLGDKTNAIDGVPVSHQEMTAAYKDKWTDNPLYEQPGEVEKWFETMRRGG